MKKEMNEIINPFANKGRMITGSNFVGRFKGLKTVANKVTDLCTMGEHKVRPYTLLAHK